MADYRIMRLTEKAAEEIRVALARRRMSARELARRLQVSPPWVNDRLNGEKDITLNDLEVISIELDVPIRQLLGIPGADVAEELMEVQVILDDEDIPQAYRDFLLKIQRRVVPMWRDIPRPDETPAVPAPSRRGRR